MFLLFLLPKPSPWLPFYAYISLLLTGDDVVRLPPFTRRFIFVRSPCSRHRSWERIDLGVDHPASTRALTDRVQLYRIRTVLFFHLPAQGCYINIRLIMLSVGITQVLGSCNCHEENIEEKIFSVSTFILEKKSQPDYTY